ncbi:MAG: STAS domain-containing protein [SAR324 cluster bacterium]|nr:STAS domain-containing protein [SAR324 cluster bacterium]
MELSHRVENDIHIMSIEGEMVWNKIQGINLDTSKLLEDGGLKALLVNLEKVTKIDSFGTTMLITFFKASNEKKIPFALCHLSKNVHDVLQLAQLHKLLSIYEKEQEALASFQMA